MRRGGARAEHPVSVQESSIVASALHEEHSRREAGTPTLRYATAIAFPRDVCYVDRHAKD